MKKEKKNNFFFYLRQFCTCNKNLQGEDVDPQDSFTLAPEFFFIKIRITGDLLNLDPDPEGKKAEIKPITEGKTQLEEQE